MWQKARIIKVNSEWEKVFLDKLIWVDGKPYYQSAGDKHPITGKIGIKGHPLFYGSNLRYNKTSIYGFPQEYLELQNDFQEKVELVDLDDFWHECQQNLLKYRDQACGKKLK